MGMGAKTERFDSFYTSYPSAIIKDIVEFYTSGDLWKHASITLQEALSALIVGCFLGIIVAALFGQFKILGSIFTPILTAINSVPQLTLAPLYILWFGLGLTSKVFLAGLMVFFVVFFATYGAINNIDRKLIEISTMLGAGTAQTWWHVILPACMPSILGGIRGGIGASIVGSIIGEYMGATAGFGWMVAYASSYFIVTRVMSCVFLLLFMGIILNYLLNFVESKILRWHSQHQKNNKLAGNTMQEY